jgi:Protein of unknown function (DUF3617)
MIRALILANSLLVLTVTALADEFPARKAGLWEITTNTGGSSPAVTRLCLDDATETELLKKGNATMNTICSRHEVHRNGNVVTQDSVCRPMSSEVTARAVTTFTGDAAYTTQTTSHYDPPFMGRADQNITQDGKWLGPCGSDMRPGDMIVRGRKLNVLTTPAAP